MAKKFSELRSKMSPDAQDRMKVRTQQMLRELRLAKLRRARELTQQQLAAELEVNQAWISKIERQTDMYISTLRAYVDAAGGELQLIAKFKDEVIRIDQIDELDRKETTPQELAEIEPAKETVVSEEIGASVYQSEATVEIPGIKLFTGAQSNTGRSRTPSSNTRKFSKAA